METEWPDYVSFDVVSKDDVVEFDHALAELSNALAEDLKLSAEAADERAGAELLTLYLRGALQCGEDDVPSVEKWNYIGNKRFGLKNLAAAVNTIERSVVAEMAQAGIIAPDQAEARALARRFAPFASFPSPETFDPVRSRNASDWTLLMSFAWIVGKGNIAFVRDCWSEYREQCYVWKQFDEGCGWYITQLPPASIASLPNVDYSHAQAALWPAFREGKIVATALDKQGQPISIPAASWSFLSLAEFGGHLALSLPADRHSATPTYRDVRTLRAGVISAFPSMTPLDEPLMPEAAAGTPVVKSRRGRKLIYDWQDAMDYARKKLDELGDFDDPQFAEEGWRSQADLMRLVLSYMAKHNGGKEPTESSVKERLRKLMDEWRNGRK